VVIVTNAGNVIDTDRLLMLFIRDIVPRYQHPKVVFDVKCSNLLSALIEENGGIPVMSRSGHSFMKQKMQDSNAVVGAEFSAHVFIKDRWFGFDDGMYVAARFLEMLAASPLSAEQLLQSLPTSVVTPELRIEVSDEDKFTLMALIAELADFPQARINTLDGIRADFRHGWGLIRASNTTPALLLRFEADNQETLQQIQQQFRDLLSRVDTSLRF
jgi:phosphomannomutase/phosphoglucomutase